MSKDQTLPDYRPNRWLFALYEVALLGFLGLALLVCLHGRSVGHATVRQTLDANRAAIQIPPRTAVSPGAELAVYRFHEAWKEPIGRATVESVTSGEGVLRFDPNQFRWPMGRHGTITEVDGKTARLNVGSMVGFQPGDRLVVFRDRIPVGRLELASLTPETASATVIEAEVPLAAGMTVSEFTVATQALIEPTGTPPSGFAAMGLLVLWLGCWAVTRRSPFVWLGRGLQKAKAICPDWGFRALDLVAGAFFIRFFTVLACQLATGTTNYPFDRFAEPLWVINFLAYAYQYRKTSLLAGLREMVAFKGGLIAQTSTRNRDFAIFVGHLAIAWAFGNSLITFLQGNLNAAITHAWPEAAQLPLGGFGERLGYALSHAPHFATADDVFASLRYLFWTLTILGCLVGYGHSILGYLWGKRIRNLDFTLTGWVVNGWCYGPLLGWVIWQSAPSTAGTDPTFGPGFLATYQNVLELLLNVLYTFSIWNLGVMFGVMTDKGVCKSGFYTLARHPSYTLEALMFITMEFRGLSGPAQWGAVSLYLLIYYLRSEREDDFMGKSNPEYAVLRRATPWKFIPYVY